MRCLHVLSGLRDRGWDLAVSAALWLVLFSIYLGNSKTLGSGDTLAARYIPVSILTQFDFDLDEFAELYDDAAVRRYGHGNPLPYFLVHRNGYYSQYSPGSALAAVPVYAIPVLAGKTEPWHLKRLEKIAAASITALSAVFLFWALRRLIAAGWAVAVTLAYAFGSSSFSVSSQALWQHGPSQLFLALSLWLLVKGRADSSYIPYAGLTLASSVVMRPTDALLALAVGLYVLQKHRSHFVWFAMLALPPLAFLVAYNWLLLGSLVGYPDKVHLPIWSTPLWQGLTGLLFSPGRGLFVYSPVFLLSLVGLAVGWRRGDGLLKYLAGGALAVVLLYSKHFQWWGGWCYGPRYLADLTPILAFCAYPIFAPPTRRLHKVAFVFLALLSIGAHTVGTYWNDGRWDGRPNVNRNVHRLWDWRDNPILHCSRIAYYRAGHVYKHIRLRQTP